MNLPKRCGKMYIKFDENNQPEYGFEFYRNHIKKFFPLSDKEIDTIILPKIVEDSDLVITTIDEESPNISLLYFQKQNMKDYIEGRVKICDGCFQGIKKAKIIVPFENSIMLDWGCFEDDSEIEFLLPENLTLKQIYRSFDTGFDYDHENWTLIGDKNITGQFGWSGFLGEHFSIFDYNEEELEHKVANLSTTNSLQLEQDNEIDNQFVNNIVSAFRKKFESMNQAEREEYLKDNGFDFGTPGDR